MDSIDTQIQKIFDNLSAIKEIINTGNQKTIYLVFGDEGVGKTTFIHYLLQNQLEFTTNEEGQDVFNIMDQANFQQYSSILPKIYDSNDGDTYYFQIPSLDWKNATNIQKWEKLISIDFFLKQLTNAKIKLLLLIPTASDQAHTLTNFKQLVNHIPNFQQFTSVVLTKPSDESEFIEFLEKNCTSIIQDNQDLNFLKNIKDEQRILCFYCADIEEEQRTEITQKLQNLAHVDTSEMEPKDYSHIQFQDNQIDEISQSVKKMAKLISEIANNCIVVHANRLAGIDMKKLEAVVSSLEKYLLEFKNLKLDLTQKFTKTHASISTENVKYFIKAFELLKIKIGHEPKLFLQCAHKFNKFYDQINASQYFDSYFGLLLICNKSFTFLNEELFDLVCFQQGGLSDGILSGVYKKHKQSFSEEFVEEYGKKLETGKVKKVVKKQKKKIIIKYADQRKQVENQSIEEHIKLPISPLKIDLFIEYLKRNQNQKSRQAIWDQKIIIKKLSQMLEIYNLYKEAILCSCIIPDFNNIQVLIEQLVKKHRNVYGGGKLPKQKMEFLKQIALFCCENKREYIIEDLKEYLFSKMADEKEQFSSQLDNVRTQHNMKKVFMNYEFANSLFEEHQSIVENCIEYEKQNVQQIQSNLAINYILEQFLPSLGLE